MTCSECKKRPAEIHLNAVYEGAPYQKDLCGPCAHRLGVTGAFADAPDEALQFPTASPLLSELFSLLAHWTLSAVSTPVRACPKCRWTLSDLQRTGNMGCADCYRVFYDDLRDVVKKIHGHVQHKGKPAPAEPPRPKQRPQRDAITELKRDLESAIKEERFEAAAQLRDKLRALDDALRRRAPS
jgi:protein arginine kinase activator